MIYSFSVTSRFNFRFSGLLKKKKKERKAHSGTRWLEAVTIHFKKPVNQKATEQSPSVFTFPKQGERKAWTPHQCMCVQVCGRRPTFKWQD